MPPAVAQAPIVTSTLDWALISLIRRASAAVVMEPSTSDRSYGPGSTWLDASRKCEICTASARSSSSSSQSSSVSWHPSHEANFHTAKLGRPSSISQLPCRQQRPGALVVDDRSVAADQQRPELAVTAQADATLHVALKRDPDVAGSHLLGEQHVRREAHHRLRPADEGDRPSGVDLECAQRLGDETHLATPAGRRLVDGE